MKKIITLLFCAGMVTAAFAQTPQDEARRVILGGGNNNGNNGGVYDRGGSNYPGTNYPYPGTYPTRGSRQAQADQVNRDYDAKIYSIQNNRYLSYEEKQRMIRQLNNDRERVLRQLNNGYDDRYYENDNRYKKQKGNNGNHYGWEKGKGNPHKSRY